MTAVISKMKFHALVLRSDNRKGAWRSPRRNLWLTEIEQLRQNFYLRCG